MRAFGVKWALALALALELGRWSICITFDFNASATAAELFAQLQLSVRSRHSAVGSRQSAARFCQGCQREFILIASAFRAVHTQIHCGHSNLHQHSVLRPAQANKPPQLSKELCNERGWNSWPASNLIGFTPSNAGKNLSNRRP